MEDTDAEWHRFKGAQTGAIEQLGVLAEQARKEAGDEAAMDRVIAAHLKPLLMREILFGTLKAGGKVRVQVENGALKLQPATE